MLYGGAFLLLIPVYLSPEDQGFWFTLMALGAMSRLADMGFLNLVMTYNAHANVGKDFSEREVIAYTVLWRNQVIKFVFPIIAIIGVLLLSIQSRSTLLFFSWIWYVVALALVFFLFHKLALLEGRGEIVRTHFHKGLLYLLATFFSFLFIIYFQTILALPASLFMAAISVYFFSKRSISFKVDSVLSGERRNKLGQEFKLLIKKTSLSWVGGYIGTQGIVPMVYLVLGPAASGLVGMTLNVFVAIQNFANVFLLSIAPNITKLVALGQIQEAKSMINRGLLKALITFLLGVSVFLIFSIFGSNWLIFDRVLIDKNVYFLALGFLFQIAIYSMAMIMRACKQEPLGPMSFYSGSIGLILLVFAMIAAGQSFIFVGFLISSFIAFLWTAYIFYSKNFLSCSSHDLSSIR